ncbi:MAG: efflux RND transporter periplasmic adaptor subunit [Candidatus Moranbacteria bacterium]|nr:efflux RND transporter periplasmic adaptor subunit [Candidatus Moranbacteria bacterium]
MNKKKIIAAISAVLLLFIFALRYQSKNIEPTKETIKKPISVTAKSAADSKEFLQKKQYPANVVGDQEVKITAKSAGTIVVAPGNIGDRVNVGTLLAKIDDTGTLNIGEDGLKSIMVQQANIASEQAKKSYSLAKDIYNDIKDSSSATRTQKDNAKAQRDIARLQYENTLLGLSGSIDNHLMLSPIAGVITNKTVSVGDSVSAGQQLATISKSANIKIQFFVEQEQRNNLIRGQRIAAFDATGNSISLLIRNISVSADQMTKRFLIEAYPEKQGQTTLLAGTIATVNIETITKPKMTGNLILPLSAIGTGQNESYIFVAENNVAKKQVVQIVKVDGENAEIASSISNETLIIIDGNKLLRGGETIALQN